MALVVGSSGGAGGRGRRVRIIFSGLLQRLLGLRPRLPRAVAPSASYRADERSPLMDDILPRSTISGSPSRSLFGRGSASARMFGADPLQFGHPDWPAHQVFDDGPAWPESAKGSLEMTAGTRHVARLPRERGPGQPPVVVVETVPGLPPVLHIPLTDGLVASFLAQAVRGRTDGSQGVTTDRPSIPASSDSKGGPTQWMKMFRGLLLAHVFFALPLIVIFFSRYDKGSKNALLLSLFDNMKEDTEKLIVLGLFVVHASLGSLGVLLAHIADGPDCTGIVGSLTLCVTISVVGFIDYIFRKILPPETIYDIVFGVHFIVMLLVICGLWTKFVGFSPCCCSKLDSRRRSPV